MTPLTAPWAIKAWLARIKTERPDLETMLADSFVQREQDFAGP